jgi:hypothetical protein
LIRNALEEGMFADVSPDQKKKELVDTAVKRLSALEENKTHSKHFHYNDCLAMGLTVDMLEDKKNGLLQDLVLTVHYCFIITLANTGAYKIIENHLGRASIRQQVAFVQPQQFTLGLPPELQAQLMKELEEEKKKRAEQTA